MNDINPTMSADADGTSAEATGVPATAEWALWGKKRRTRSTACSAAATAR